MQLTLLTSSLLHYQGIRHILQYSIKIRQAHLVNCHCSGEC
jgi:hypothetical protein